MPAQIYSNGGSVSNIPHTDGVYIFEQAPTPSAGAGVNTSLSAIVGTASWGPIGVPTAFSDTASLYNAFGRSLVGANNLVTEGYFATAFSNNFYGIRVTDGSDVAASAIIKDSASPTPANAIKISGKYTGIEGNNIQILLSTGSQSTATNPTMTCTVMRLGYPNEVFPNIANPAASGAFWTNLANALNNGISGVRPASNYVVASTNSYTSANPAAAMTSPVSLTGGANGDATVTASILTGSAGTANPGMYAIPAGTFQFILAGCVDPTVFPTIASYAAGIGALAIGAFASGTSTSSAITSKATNNGASVNLALVKDFINFFDPTANSGAGQTRSVSPLGEVLGVIASLPPEASPGNKPYQGLSNILSTERTGTPYSSTEMSQLEDAGILVITNPIPRGNVYGLFHGQNSSGIPGQDGINYTRMTNYLAQSLAGLLGQFVGELQGASPNDPTRRNARAVINSFLAGMVAQNRIAGYNVQLDTANNTATTVGQGFLIAAVQVQYLSVVRYFLVSLQGGNINIQVTPTIQ